MGGARESGAPHPLGLHRVVAPAGMLPQGAEAIDNAMPMQANELLIEVTALNVDAASFVQIEGEAKGDVRAIAERVLAIVARRGKLHNPVTGSGGMLIGRVKAIGPDFPNPDGPDSRDLRVGDRIATLVSLSLTPLRIDGIRAVHPRQHRIEIEGEAILFATGLYALLPDDMDETLALAVLDVAGAPAQVARLARPGDTVAVLGGAGKAGLLALAAAHEAGARTIGISPFAAECEEMRSCAWIDTAIEADARDALAVLRAVEAATGGALADLVVNCVNIPGTEMASILSVREGGTVCFFSMATSFTAAALGAEGVGKDASLLIGNGYARGHAEYALGLLRSNDPLRAIFARRYGRQEQEA